MTEGMGKGEREHTASAPSLFFQSIHLGNRSAINAAVLSDFSRADTSGVSMSAFLEMPCFSWPASMRNSYHQKKV